MNNSIPNESTKYHTYTSTPTYWLKDKKEYLFLGRFSHNMIEGNIGFNHIFTILARRYLFHNVSVSSYEKRTWQNEHFVLGALRYRHIETAE